MEEEAAAAAAAAAGGCGGGGGRRRRRGRRRLHALRHRQRHAGSPKDRPGGHLRVGADPAAADAPVRLEVHR